MKFLLLNRAILRKAGSGRLLQHGQTSIPITVLGNFSAIAVREMPLKREPDAINGLPLGKIEGETVVSNGCQLESKAKALVIQLRAAQITADIPSSRRQHLA